MNNESELKGCPFCGCMPTDGIVGDGTGQPKFTIKCPDCPGGMRFFSSTKDQAISAWNCRAALAEPKQEMVARPQNPVAHVWFHRGMANFDAEDSLSALHDRKGIPVPLYAAPPLVDLTDEQIQATADKYLDADGKLRNAFGFAHAIIAQARGQS